MTGRRTNREILSGGKNYIQKQTKKYGVNEVVFDKDSRKDYLTGFHKRKLQRQKKAQEYIKEQDRLAKIEERKRLRDERKREIDERLQKFNDTVLVITHDSEDEDWGGFDDSKESKDSDEASDANESDQDTETPKGILRRKEVYQIEDPSSFQNTDAVIDEDTTVTVESVDNPLMTNIQQIGLEAKAKANYVDLNKAEEVLEDSIKRAQNYAVTAGVAKKPAKKKKFRYLTKTERKDTRMKQKMKKLKLRKRD